MTLQSDIAILERAIREGYLITLVYQKDTESEYYSRKGNPHAVYTSTTTGKILLDLYQWYGDSDTAKQWRWKQLDLTKCNTIRLDSKIKGESSAIGYNPTSPRYEKALFKREERRA